MVLAESKGMREDAELMQAELAAAGRAAEAAERKAAALADMAAEEARTWQGAVEGRIVELEEGWRGVEECVEGARAGCEQVSCDGDVTDGWSRLSVCVVQHQEGMYGQCQHKKGGGGVVKSIAGLVTGGRIGRDTHSSRK